MLGSNNIKTSRSSVAYSAMGQWNWKWKSSRKEENYDYDSSRIFQSIRNCPSQL